MKQLTISKTLHLPAELAARTQAILAMKGVGKTYVAMKETEEMLKLDQQVVCFDPTGVWYGLRSSANGKAEGFPILIFGGDNADVPLEPTAGEYLADFVQDSGRSVIFDMSHFESNAAQDRFVTDFATRIYRCKAPKEKRNTIHLMLDEADSFAPQRPAKNQLKMLGAWEAIVRRGRSRGIGLTMITQRPAVLNKNVLSQVDLLVCLRIVGIHDFKAVKEWTDLYATPEQKKSFMETLPSLQTGEGWFWSPGWLRIFQRTQIDEKITFDSSRTPEPGESAKAPKRVAAVNIGELTEQIKATVEAAKQNDPKALKVENAKLRAQLAAKPVQAAPVTTIVTTIKDVPVFAPGEFEKVEDIESRMIALCREFKDSLDGIQKTLNSAGVMALHPNVKRAVAGSSPSRGRSDRSSSGVIGIGTPTARPAARVTNSSPASDGALAPRHQDIIDALGFFRTIGVEPAEKPQIAGFVTRSFNGNFRSDLAVLRTAGLVDYPQPGTINLTDSGTAAIQNVPDIRTRSDLHRMWLQKLAPRHADILRFLLQEPESTFDKTFVAQNVNREFNGNFRSDLSVLRTLGTIDYPAPGTVAISKQLLPPLPA